MNSNHNITETAQNSTKIETIELQSDNEYFDYPESKDTYLQSIFGPDLNFLETGLTFRSRMQRLLDSNKFHVLVIILVLIDTVCVAGELIISLENKNDNKTLTIIEDIFKYLGVIILGLFLFEIMCKIGFNTHHFIKSKLEIFDGLIVIVSFILDIVFFENGASPAFGLITILRLWRIARIVNGS
jgi:hypothetical protein